MVAYSLDTCQLAESHFSPDFLILTQDTKHLINHHCRPWSYRIAFILIGRCVEKLFKMSADCNVECVLVQFAVQTEVSVAVCFD